MLTAELLKKIRKIEISTRRVVSETFAGQYHSVFKGQGIEFAEVRPYTSGDEIRFIDWNVSARQNSLFVKRFAEERELTVMIIADLSGSTHFGSIGRLKSEVIAEISAILAFSAIDNKDRVGAILFTDGIERYIPPMKGRRHVLSIISEILSFTPRSRKTDIRNALKFAMNILKRRSVIFLLSDFMDKGFEKELTIASKKHDLVAFRLYNTLERTMNLPFEISMMDPESDELCIINNTDYNTHSRIGRSFSEREANIRDLFKKGDLDYLDLDISSDYIASLVRFFRLRQKEAAGR